jgi:hypothetical protein
MLKWFRYTGRGRACCRCKQYALFGWRANGI